MFEFVVFHVFCLQSGKHRKFGKLSENLGKCGKYWDVKSAD